MKIAGAILGCLLILASCQQATSSSGSSTKSLTVESTSSSTYQYYNLSTGNEVTDSASNTWDIAFDSETGGILTNSGATAMSLASNGQGGVYYSGSVDFDSVSSYDASKFANAFATDTTAYVSTDMGSGPVTSTLVLNQMTKLDYDGGTGTSGDPYTNSGDAAVYSGPAYYAYDPTTHVISVSSEVYIVRQADGAHYSKLQVVSMTGSNADRTRVIKYANF